MHYKVRLEIHACLNIQLSLVNPHTLVLNSHVFTGINKVSVLWTSNIVNQHQSLKEINRRKYFQPYGTSSWRSVIVNHITTGKFQNKCSIWKFAYSIGWFYMILKPVSSLSSSWKWYNQVTGMWYFKAPL